MEGARWRGRSSLPVLEQEMRSAHPSRSPHLPRSPRLPRFGPRSRAAALLPLFALAGCTDMNGHWFGACDFGSTDFAYVYQAEMESDVESGSGRTFEGNFTFDMSGDRSFKGDLKGERNGTFIEVTSELKNDEGTFVFTASGDLDQDEIHGACALAVPGGTGALQGDWTFER